MTTTQHDSELVDDVVLLRQRIVQLRAELGGILSDSRLMTPAEDDPSTPALDAMLADTRRQLRQTDAKFASLRSRDSA